MTEEKQITKQECNDKFCPIHGHMSLRGRTFRGKVIKKFPRRVAIEFERTLFIKKYERYPKKINLFLQMYENLYHQESHYRIYFCFV